MDSRTFKLVGPSILIAVGLAGPVAEAVEPALYELGEAGAIAPHLRFEFGTDNNPLRSESGSQESAYLRMQPSVAYLLRRRNNRLAFGYTGDFFQYFEEYCQGRVGVARPGDCRRQNIPTSDRASYQDHELSMNGFLEVTKRLRATLDLSRIIEHQPLGTGLSANNGVLDLLTTPDNWSRSEARAQLSYGAFQARGELRAGISLSDRELRSDRDVNLDALSDTSVAPFAQLLYRVGTRTQLLAGFSFDQVRDGVLIADNGDVIQDLERDITRLSFGVEFDASSVTSGSFSVDSVAEDFLTGNRDLNFLGFDVNLIWRPRSFSTVTITGGRETGTGFVGNDLSLNTTFGVNWVHFWRERLSSRVRVNYRINEDLDEDNITQGVGRSVSADDRTTSFRFEGSYNIRRWLDIGGFVDIDSRDGRGDDRDFERTVIGISANGTI